LLLLLLLLLQNSVTHRLLLMPAMPAGQALQWLAKGPAQTEMMMQWQVRKVFLLFMSGWLLHAS
jgi:hypothetical protein